MKTELILHSSVASHQDNNNNNKFYGQAYFEIWHRYHTVYNLNLKSTLIKSHGSERCTNKKKMEKDI